MQNMASSCRRVRTFPSLRLFAACHETAESPQIKTCVCIAHSLPSFACAILLEHARRKVYQVVSLQKCAPHTMSKCKACCILPPLSLSQQLKAAHSVFQPTRRPLFTFTVDHVVSLSWPCHGLKSSIQYSTPRQLQVVKPGANLFDLPAHTRSAPPSRHGRLGCLHRVPAL